jgi:hypothetical protein
MDKMDDNIWTFIIFPFLGPTESLHFSYTSKCNLSIYRKYIAHIGKNIYYYNHSLCTIHLWGGFCRYKYTDADVYTGTKLINPFDNYIGIRSDYDLSKWSSFMMSNDYLLNKFYSNSLVAYLPVNDSCDSAMVSDDYIKLIIKYKSAKILFLTELNEESYDAIEESDKSFDKIIINYYKEFAGSPFFKDLNEDENGNYSYIWESYNLHFESRWELPFNELDPHLYEGQKEYERRPLDEYAQFNPNDPKAPIQADSKYPNGCAEMGFCTGCYFTHPFDVDMAYQRGKDGIFNFTIKHDPRLKLPEQTF